MCGAVAMGTEAGTAFLSPASHQGVYARLRRAMAREAEPDPGDWNGHGSSAGTSKLLYCGRFVSVPVSLPAFFFVVVAPVPVNWLS